MLRSFSWAACCWRRRSFASCGCSELRNRHQFRYRFGYLVHAQVSGVGRLGHKRFYGRVVTKFECMYAAVGVAMLLLLSRWVSASGSVSMNQFVFVCKKPRAVFFAARVNVFVNKRPGRSPGRNGATNTATANGSGRVQFPFQMRRPNAPGCRVRVASRRVCKCMRAT